MGHNRLHLIYSYAESGVTEALTTDEHFQQAGFRALLRES